MLRDIVAGGIAIAHNITNDGGLQATILLSRWVSQDASGAASYAAPISLTAVVRYRSETRESQSGTSSVGKARILILTPLEPHGATGRSEPIDERDLVTMPDLQTGPILEVGGQVDGVTGTPFYHSILLGDRRGTF